MAKAKTLRLCIPGLLGPWRQRNEKEFPIPEVTALTRLLNRAELKPAPAPGTEPLLFKLFGLAIRNDQDLPVGSVTHMADGGSCDGYWWLRADPVHLRADLQQVRLFDARQLDIDSEEAQVLVDAFNQALAEDDCRLLAPVPDRWYLRLTADPGIRTHLLSEVIGKDIDHLLPRGDNEKRWHTLLTEVQMLFHQSKINYERELDDRPTVNGIWLWGGGVLPQGLRSPVDGIYADDLLSRGLAQCTQTAINPCPESADDWLQASEHETDCLVVVDTLRYDIIDQDPYRWSEQLKEVTRNWFVPCIELLKKRRLEHLRIYPGNGRLYTITAHDLRRFWRWPRALSHYLG